MDSNPINLLYFVLSLPVIILSFKMISRLAKKGEKHNKKIIIILTGTLFLVRLFLVFFANNIGIMPYLDDDVVFYPLLAFFGLLITYFYVKKVEKTTLEELGWQRNGLVKKIGLGLLGFIPLACMFPLIILLGGIQVSFVVTWEKCIVGASFAILGAIYEEIMFRGVIQNRISKFMKIRGKIFLTAFIFTLTHLFYLPFQGFGIYYIFVCCMALILSFLREKGGQVPCAILHGGIVFILIIAV